MQALNKGLPQLKCYSNEDIIEGETWKHVQGSNLWISSKSRYFHGKELDHNASIKKVSKRYHPVSTRRFKTIQNRDSNGIKI